MTFEEYAAIEALNFSTLKEIDISPAWLKHCVDHPEERLDKAAFRQGRATHCATLEPERFLSDFVVEPDFAQMARDKFGSLRTKESQLFRDANTDEWYGKNNRPGVEIISQDELEIAMRSAVAIRKNRHAMALLEGAKFEQVARWYNQSTGLECKGRIDIQCGRIVDLKSTRRSTVREVLMDAARLGYHAQVAWYHDGAKQAGLISGELEPMAIFVNAPPRSTFADVVVLDMGKWFALEAGRRLYTKWINLYLGCQITNNWPGMSDAVVPWTLPDWAILEEGDDEE